MKQLSVADIKYNRQAYYKTPDDSTKVGKIYKLLTDNRGRFIDLSEFKNLDGALYYLRNSYGMDIITKSKTHMLAGELVYNVYIDYVCERKINETN